MRKVAQWSVAGTVLAALLLLAPVAAWSAEAASRAPQTKVVGVINVNTATPEQLELLPGIGPSRARAIVEYRREHGPFKEVDDLVQVSGIGAKALENIRSHCAVSGKSTARLER
jgi:competence protein ComEA